MSPDAWMSLIAIVTVVAIPIVGMLTKDLRFVAGTGVAGIIIVLLIGVLS